MWYTLDLSKDYALCLELPGERIRSWKDGVTFWTWACDLDLFKEDHKPSFALRLEVLNHTLFGIEVYNVHHLSPEDEAAFDRFVDLARKSGQDVFPATPIE